MTSDHSCFQFHGCIINSLAIDILWVGCRSASFVVQVFADGFFAHAHRTRRGKLARGEQETLPPWTIEFIFDSMGISLAIGCFEYNMNNYFYLRCMLGDVV